MAINESAGVFFSNDIVVNFRHNVTLTLFRDRCFHLVGIMIATSILHGGSPFPYFPRVVYNYISRGEMPVDATAADVANPLTLHIISVVCLES